MDYVTTFRHIDKNFSFEALSEGAWSQEFTDDDAFIRALNCMAIASHQHAPADFPEVEVRMKSTRVTIRAINGQLYYTDLHSKNRKDLKVVPVEVVRLVQGLPLDEVFKGDEEEVQQEDEIYVLPKHRERSSVGWIAKILAIAMMFVVLGVCIQNIWQDMTYSPRLHVPPEFIPSAGEESEILRRYADVYVSEYREGAMLFELTGEGLFTRYEMWHSQERKSFVLIPLDDYYVQVGLYDGRTAMLAGELLLLEPLDDENIDLLGVNFHRHHGKLEDLGAILDIQQN